MPEKRIIKEPPEISSFGRWLPWILFALVFILAVDVAQDLYDGTTLFHVATELILVVAMILGAIFYWRRLLKAKQVELELKRHLEEVKAETSRWQEEERDLLQDLRKAINRQFDDWGLSPTDREIAYYLLKGLSLKEIAKLRGTTNQSVHQQAHMLYRKAGIGGRVELSAYFLGGLLEPDEPEQQPDEAEAEPETARRTAGSP